jgi:diguanylate cyclase (GGDEF)-like protein
VLGIGAAFANIRLKLDRAEASSALERKTGETAKLAQTCLTNVSARLMLARSNVTAITRDSASLQNYEKQVFAGLDADLCESAVFVVFERTLVSAVPEVSRQKYADLPFWSWGRAGGAAGTPSSPLAVTEGPYEDASQDWYVVVRVPFDSQDDGWLAALVPVYRLFDQTKLKEIRNRNTDIRIIDVEALSKKSITVASWGPGPFLHSISYRIPIGRNALVLEVAPHVALLNGQSSVIYGSLILIFAISAGIVGHESISEKQRLKSEINKRDRNLREVKGQLTQILKNRDRTEKLSIGVAYQDMITGLPNWLYYVKNLESSLHRISGNRKELLTVVMAEMEHLTELQNSLSSFEIEDLLKQAVRRLESQLRPADLAASRLGGSEIAFLLFDSGTEEERLRILKNLSGVLEEPFVMGDKTVFLGMALGVSDSRQHQTADLLIQHAETELLKVRLKKHVRRTDTSPYEDNAERPEGFADIERAIERNELRLEYLPMVELATRRTIGFEVLVRWHHPFKGIISPSRFIPIAEASGQGIFLTTWVIRESIRQLAEWRGTLPGIDDIFVSINLTSSEFAREGLLSTLETCLHNSALPPNRMQLELEEGILGGEVKPALELTRRLQGLGIRLAFEEFGAGHSALRSLRLVKWDSVKIAKDFGVAFSASIEQQNSLRALTHMAQDLGIECVAKAIETELAAEEFLSLGYRLGQGFLFSRPIGPDKVKALLLARL